MKYNFIVFGGTGQGGQTGQFMGVSWISI